MKDISPVVAALSLSLPSGVSGDPRALEPPHEAGKRSREADQNGAVIETWVIAGFKALQGAL